MPLLLDKANSLPADWAGDCQSAASTAHASPCQPLPDLDFRNLVAPLRIAFSFQDMLCEESWSAPVPADSVSEVASGRSPATEH